MRIEADIDGFQEAIQRLAELQDKTTKEVVLDQGALFCRDAIQLMPPFGNTPLKEAHGIQRAIGEKAVRRGINRLFRGMDSMWAMRNPEIDKAFKRIARKKNALEAEVFLREIGFKRVAGVVDAPTPELHNKFRNAKGKVEKGGAQLFTWKASVVERFRKAKYKLIGLAKAGFVFASVAINSLRSVKGKARIPAWVARHSNAQGAFEDFGSDDSFGIIISNLVPHAQKHDERVKREGWVARTIAAPRQAEAIYKAMVRKARSLKL